jgi:His/Glu/Gln/Arg/opine family amino acid ABC transporter permease subunit
MGHAGFPACPLLMYFSIWAAFPMTNILSWLAPLAYGPTGWGDELLYGAWLTIAISLCSYAIGLALGLLGALAKLSNHNILRSIAWFYTTVVRAVPELLLILLIYYTSTSAIRSLIVGLGIAKDFEVNSFLAACLALGIVQGAYGTEVFRGAIISLGTGQPEAGKSLGLSNWLTFRLIIFPQMLRNALPALGNLWLVVLKESSLISVVGYSEVLFTAKTAAGSTHHYMYFFSVAGLAFLILSMLSTSLFQIFENHAGKHLRRA